MHMKKVEVSCESFEMYQSTYEREVETLGDARVLESMDIFFILSTERDRRDGIKDQNFRVDNEASDQRKYRVPY